MNMEIPEHIVKKSEKWYFDRVARTPIHADRIQEYLNPITVNKPILTTDSEIFSKTKIFKKNLKFTKEDQFTVHFDGSCDVNPGGNMGFGWHLDKIDGNKEIKVAEGWGYLLSSDDYQTSNNLAEWAALYYAVSFAVSLDLDLSKVKVFGDSLMVINQAIGYWKISSDKAYFFFAEKFKREITKHSDIYYKWVRRDLNQRADILSNKYIKKIKK